MYVNGLRPLAACAFAALLMAAACGKETPATGGPPPNAKLVDEAKAGTVSGRVTVQGPIPANPPMNMSGDSYCQGQNPNGAAFEHFVADDGGLENVFVYVTDTFDYYFPVPADAARLDQQRCHYTPHVLGVRVGQTLAVANSDDTMHNVHATPSTNAEWTKGQPLRNIVDERVFTAREVMVPFKCDVHNWMHAYVGVMDHPYFAVTRNGGRFELAKLPAGTYTVAAWHEKLGTLTQRVTLGEKESKEIAFTFKASSAGTD